MTTNVMDTNSRQVIVVRGLRHRAVRAGAIAAVLSGLVLACQADRPDVAQSTSAVTGGGNGHVTNVCGYTLPLPPGFVGSSPIGPCDGACTSSWTDGSCAPAADRKSVV